MDDSEIKVTSLSILDMVITGRDCYDFVFLFDDKSSKMVRLNESELRQLKTHINIWFETEKFRASKSGRREGRIYRFNLHGNIGGLFHKFFNLDAGTYVPVSALNVILTYFNIENLERIATYEFD